MADLPLPQRDEPYGFILMFTVLLFRLRRLPQPRQSLEARVLSWHDVCTA